MNANQVWRIGAAAASATVLALSLCSCTQADSKTPEAAAPGSPVAAAAVIEKTVTETQEFTGRMEAIERVDVRPRVSGFITSVNITPGALVHKGAVLFVIDQRPFQAEANRAEAAANAARAKVDLAKIELNRAEKLLGEKAIAQREFDSSSSLLKELAATARAAEAQSENARLNLTYTRVTSPIDGRVGKAEITLGNLVDTSMVLTTIVSDEKIYVTFTADEDTFSRVGAASRRGEMAEVRIGLATEAGFPRVGKLEFVDNQLDAQTGAVRMRGIFDNRDKTLAPGLFARVQVRGGNGSAEATMALLINERAVGTDQSRKFVYLIDANSKAEYRPVRLGPIEDGLRVVRSGLRAGDRIVVNGVQRVQPGALLAPHIVAMDFDPDAPVVAAANPAAKGTP